MSSMPAWAAICDPISIRKKERKEGRRKKRRKGRERGRGRERQRAGRIIGRKARDDSRAVVCTTADTKPCCRTHPGNG